ncbi:plasmid maintenance system killer protein [Shinella kummerowiae]|jgi:proteic killer suppression protein|uniref:Plasmid maintenance system killer protein n=1 Tax=Shinella kummerowiae TaxID=417745 RepID=A0A6N8SGS2_9HYPH|nr:type II toxin-antitoxin system RelE/ParE family toxin [Shinella kummerowiae]MXN46848.1 plasmid maintenance system killer protein [Shinella kummerowiae]
MIKSIADTATRQFLETGKSRFSGLDAAKAMARLNVLNAARSLDDISPLRSIGLHKLSGNRKGQWAMTINGPWRLCFLFENGDAYDVEIVDYH